MCPETEPLARPRFSCYELVTYVYVVFLSLEPSEVNKSDPFPHIHSMIHRCVRVPRDACRRVPPGARTPRARPVWIQL